MKGEALKAVVQYKIIDWEPFEYPLAETKSIGPDRHDGLRTSPGNQIRFVAGIIRSDQHPLAVGHQYFRACTAPAIASAEDRDPFSFCQQPIGQEDDDRRLTRSSNREISHADDR